jgi:hypothetical protein
MIQLAFCFIEHEEITAILHYASIQGMLASGIMSVIIWVELFVSQYPIVAFEPEANNTANDAFDAAYYPAFCEFACGQIYGEHRHIVVTTSALLQASVKCVLEVE